MKKGLWGIVLGLGLLVLGCAGGNTLIDFGKDPAKLTVNLQTSAPGTKSYITVTPLEIVQATVILAYPGGGSDSYVWTPGNSLIHVFTSEQDGTHILTVIEVDDDGHVQTNSANINMAAGYNYQVDISLGGTIYIEDSTNTNSTNTNTTNTNIIQYQLTTNTVYLILSWTNIAPWAINTLVSNTNLTAVVSGSEGWLHTDGLSIWSCSNGKPLTINYGSYSGNTFIIIPANSTNYAEFKMTCAQGWGLFAENGDNHAITLPLSGVITQTVGFGAGN